MLYEMVGIEDQNLDSVKERPTKVESQGDWLTEPWTSDITQLLIRDHHPSPVPIPIVKPNFRVVKPTWIWTIRENMTWLWIRIHKSSSAIFKRLELNEITQRLVCSAYERYGCSIMYEVGVSVRLLMLLLLLFVGRRVIDQKPCNYGATLPYNQKINPVTFIIIIIRYSWRMFSCQLCLCIPLLLLPYWMYSFRSALKDLVRWCSRSNHSRNCCAIHVSNLRANKKINDLQLIRRRYIVDMIFN